MAKEIIPVYALFLADSKSNFDWVYTVPKPYYDTKEEAEKIREELIQKEENITKENSKVKRVWKIEE